VTHPREAALVEANHVLLTLSPLEPGLELFGSVVTLDDRADVSGNTVYWNALIERPLVVVFGHSKLSYLGSYVRRPPRFCSPDHVPSAFRHRLQTPSSWPR